MDLSKLNSAYSLTILFTIVYTSWQVVLALRNQAKAKATLGWPTVKGVIVASNSTPVPTGVEWCTYAVTAEYRYSVQGREYMGNRIRADFPNWLYSYETALSTLERYPVGQKVRVHYCPTDPAKSILEPGIGSEARVQLVALVCFLGLCVIMLLTSF